MRDLRTRIAALTTVLGLGGLGGYALSATRTTEQPTSTLAGTHVIRRTVHAKPRPAAHRHHAPEARTHASTGTSGSHSSSVPVSSGSSGSSSSGSHHSPVHSGSSGSGHHGSGGRPPVQSGTSGSSGSGGGTVTTGTSGSGTTTGGEVEQEGPDD